MRALSCPKCGAPLPGAVPACPYCRVGLVHEAPAPEESIQAGPVLEPAAAPAEPAAQPHGPAVPADWMLHSDPWRGFSLAHPWGWQVVCTQGQITVREDPVGMVAVMIWPFPLPNPMTAQQLAFQITEMLRRTNPTYQIWLQDNAAPDSPRVSVKLHVNKYGQDLEGVYNILVEGGNAIISGYSAPVQVVAQRSPQLSQILSTFRSGPMMPRQQVRDPSEGAFTLSLPKGWSFQGGISRNNIGGSGAARFTASKGPQGLVQAGMPYQMWTFMEGMGGWLGALGGYQTRQFCTADVLCQQFVAPWMAQFQSGFRLEAAVDRPDLTELSMIEMAQSGYPPGSYDASMAMMETTYNEGGARLRQKSRLACLRMRTGMESWGMGNSSWVAFFDIYWRAPEAEFTAWEPILTGIHESYKLSPAWKAGEQQLARNYIANSQADSARRMRQISQTLSETSDIITSGYWERQATYDRISEMRSNTMLEVHNVVSDSGDLYKVPNGYDQYWSDGLGNLYGGSWLSQPDLNWKPLTPTGI